MTHASESRNHNEGTLEVDHRISLTTGSKGAEQQWETPKESNQETKDRNI